MRTQFVATGAALLAALTLAWAASAAREGDGERHEVSIKDLRYDPSTIEVKAGDTVRWVNQDDRDHTVVAEDDAFDSGKIGAGDSFEHTFGQPGKFSYHCDYHPRMKGKVVVRK